MGNEGAPPRRPVVGLMTGSFHTDYSIQITEAISRHLRREGIDVVLFQGLDASRFLNIEGYVDKGFDDHYYSQFEYSRFVRPDLIIASVGTISAVREPLSLGEFRALLPEVPLIALEVEETPANGASLFLDNYQGMYDCIEHLIDAHGCRDILFVSGPKGVEDAEKRLSAYLDAMGRRGLPVTEDMICCGDFTDHADPLVEQLLDKHPRPDAIVCANDEMAESAYRVLQARGLRPGVDVAVTGFDDNPVSAMMNPPLTTVRQSMEQIAERAVAQACAFLRGETPASVSLPAQLVVRESCGCAPAPAAGRPARGSAAPIQVMKDRQQIKRLAHESILASVMLRNLLNQNTTVHTFFRKLGSALHLLGAESSWIALLAEPTTVENHCRQRLPDTLCLHMVQDREKVQFWSRREAPLLRAEPEGLPPTLRPGTGGCTAVFPLFYANTHYGVFVVRLNLPEMLLFYTLSLQIGTGLRYLYMALDEQEARTALEEKNQILDFSATHDGLTGLYNRVGVVKQIYSYIHANGEDARYVAVMADLDHLKQINDAFGHSMGDHAIRKAAEILYDALPKGAPLGRSGGDEFMGLFLADSPDAAETFYRRVKEGCTAYNALAETPYFQEISVGCWQFQAQKLSDMLEQFKHADDRLYQDKLTRRSSVLRPRPCIQGGTPNEKSENHRPADGPL